MEWISVKDRLPENHDRVIICSMNDINYYAYPYNYTDACEMGFYEEGKWFSDTRFDILDEHGTLGKRLILEDKQWCLDNVTHWMPLPKPPRS